MPHQIGSRYSLARVVARNYPVLAAALSRYRPRTHEILPIIAGIAGLAMIGALVGYFGAGAVVRSLLAIGWAGFSAICLIHLAVISLEGSLGGCSCPASRFGFSYGGA